MATTPMLPVSSSQISYIGYNDVTKKLYVTFRNNNKTYEYDDVSVETFKEFRASSSIGKYFSENIKSEYANRKIN